MTENRAKPHQDSSMGGLSVWPVKVNIERPSSVIPAAGYGNGTSLNNYGSNGNVWSSSPNTSNSSNAYNLNFNSGSVSVNNNNNRNNGYPVRAVRVLAPSLGNGIKHQKFLLSSEQLLEDLFKAYFEARRSCRQKDYQRKFEIFYERELVKLRDELLTRTYKPRPESCFIIHDPKMREVFSADFRDRIVHHLFYGYTHNLFERTFIVDSYSCVEGRGTLYGVKRLVHHIESCSNRWRSPCYILKLDIKGYFMHINRNILYNRCIEILDKMCDRKADETGAKWCERIDFDFVKYLLDIICHHNPVKNCRRIGDLKEWEKLPDDKSLFLSPDGCGLPIGNLSSQLFSNVYLGVLDDYVKRELRIRHYGRYVDDMYIVAETKDELHEIIPKIRSFLMNELKLELSENKTRISNAKYGVEFLGVFVKPFRTYVASKTLKRTSHKLMSLNSGGDIDIFRSKVNSLLGGMAHSKSFYKRFVYVNKSCLSKVGTMDNGNLKWKPSIKQF